MAASPVPPDRVEGEPGHINDHHAVNAALTELQNEVNARRSELPIQAGQSGKFLMTDGTVVSWATPAGGGGGGSSVWGAITGTLSTQSDLQAALDAKAPVSNTVTTDTDQTLTGAKNYATTKLLLNGVTMETLLAAKTGLPFRPKSSAMWGLPGALAYGQSNRAVPAVGRLAYYPFMADVALSITAWVVTVQANTNGTATTFRAGIYAAGEDLTPGALVTELGTVSVPATTTGEYATTLGSPVSLPRGRYLIAWTHTASMTYKMPSCITGLDSGGTGNLPIAYWASADNGAPAASALPDPGPAIANYLTDTTPYGSAVRLRWSIA